MPNFLPPRYFCDFTLPTREDGTPLDPTSWPAYHTFYDHWILEPAFGLPSSTTVICDYGFYVRWLSDYLHHAALPLSPDQQRWLAESPRKPSSIIYACAEGYGYALHDVEIIEAAIDGGANYDRFRSRMKANWENQNPTVAEREEHPFENCLCVSEIVFNRMIRERHQELQTGQTWTHTDIPFRSLLNHALRQIPDSEERFREMDFFFRKFCEEAMK